MQYWEKLRVKSRQGLLAVLLAGLAACASQGPVPEDRYYQLSPVAQEKGRLTSAATLLPGRLGVGRLKTDGLRDERTLLYVQQGQPLQIRRYHYHHWVDAPTRMIQQHMLAYLRAAGAATEVVQYQPGIRVDYEVRGRLVRFERLLSDGHGKVLVELELELRHGARSGTAPLLYRAEIEPEDDTLYAAAVAYSAALQEIYAHFLADMRTENMVKMD